MGPCCEGVARAGVLGWVWHPLNPTPPVTHHYSPCRRCMHAPPPAPCTAHKPGESRARHGPRCMPTTLHMRTHDDHLPADRFSSPLYFRANLESGVVWSPQCTHTPAIQPHTGAETQQPTCVTVSGHQPLNNSGLPLAWGLKPTPGTTQQGEQRCRCVHASWPSLLWAPASPPALVTSRLPR